MKDALGNTLMKGQAIAYCVKGSTSVYSRVGIVLEVRDDSVKVRAWQLGYWSGPLAHDVKLVNEETIFPIEPCRIPEAVWEYLKNGTRPEESAV